MENAESKYFVGDYVVYEYSGSYRREPVRLTEKIISRNGNKLEILVEWESAKEKRAWKQFVTDTVYNREHDVVDRLVLLEDGKEKELTNKNNEAAYRLYEGTYLIPQENPVLVKKEKKKMEIAGSFYLCEMKTYKTKMFGKKAEMTSVESEEFVWTHAGASYIAEDGEVLYSMRVLEFGNKEKL